MNEKIQSIDSNNPKFSFAVTLNRMNFIVKAIIACFEITIFEWEKKKKIIWKSLLIIQKQKKRKIQF